MPFTVTRQVIDDVLVLELKGYAASADAAMKFRDEVVKGINEGYKRVVLDYAQVNYHDSTFLGSLVIAYTSLRNIKAQLVFVNVQPRIMDVFKVTRLEACFQFFDTLPQALEHFRALKAGTAAQAAKEQS